MWIVLLLLVGAASQQCTLQCNPNVPQATCAFSTPADAARFAEHPLTNDGKPFPWHDVGAGESMHCNCPMGWTGLKCDVPYTRCGDGSHYCYHGGECIPELDTDFAVAQLFCNCEKAFDSEGKHYVGKYCELTASDYCDDSGLLFCLNQGSCNLNFPSVGEPCVCAEGFFGEHCQYSRGSVANMECDLACQNNGKCVLGEQPMNHQEEGSYAFWYPNEKVDHMYCSCPDDKDGELCDIDRIPCGSEFCFNGGSCVEREVEGEVLYHCDCTTASNGQTDFAGRACQFQAEEYCTTGNDFNGRLFCTNGGQCQENAYLGCLCEDQFSGFSCEFVKSEFGDGQDTSTMPLPVDSQEVTTCDIDCQNGGQCRRGIKDTGDFDEIAINAPRIGETHENYMHCVCPPGFAGLYCENAVVVCADGEHLCLNGGECVKDGEETSCSCNHEVGDDDAMFAGRHCEHSVEDICTTTKPRPGQPLLYCVNGGRCRDYVAIGESHPGCLCVNGFSGPHCELSSNSGLSPLPPLPVPPKESPQTVNVSNTGRSGIKKALLVLSVIAVTLFIGFLLVTCLQKPRRMLKHHEMVDDNIRWASEYKDSPPEVNLMARRESDRYEDFPASGVASSTDPFSTHLAVKTKQSDSLDPQIYIGPPRDEDGHELHNVDII